MEETVQRQFERVDVILDDLLDWANAYERNELFAFLVSAQMILEEARKYADS